jgi:murein DD-endopeptidase MepM/ murein hydrolase activator NlpD
VATACPVLLVFAFSAGVAYGGVLEDQLSQNKSQQGKIKRELGIIDQRQIELQRSISRFNDKLAELDGPIHQLEQQISSLDLQLTNRQARIVELREEYKQQKREIARLNLELDVANDRLAMRLVEAYKRGNSDLEAWFVGANSLRDALARHEAISRVAGLDSDVVTDISEMERKVRVKRARNHDVRRHIFEEIANIKDDRAKVDAARAKLAVKRDLVARVKGKRDAKMAALNARESTLNDNYDQLEENSSQLQDAIKNGVSTYNGQIPAGGSGQLAWPVSGPVVSGFGMRWGRMHEGIDIAVPAGTPIYAAASGVVTYATWMSGYGNMVLVAHGGNLSTGYAHQSQIAVVNGQFVAQGQLIGYVGCTGHCFGDHLHFEVRISDQAVNPLGYL